MTGMSEDWLVRGARPLELPEIVTALGELVPDLSLRGDRSGHSIVVVHQDRPVVWIGPSREVSDPWAPWLSVHDPSTRPADSAGSWWSEVTGPTQRPVPGYQVPHLLVRAVAEALAQSSGGSAVRLSAASVPVVNGAEAAAGTPPPTAPPPAADHADPPADVVNDKLTVLVQSRPVVALTPWLVNNHVWAQAHDRQFVLLTPAATELTLAAWSYLQNTDAAWVVDAGDSMYHGLIGLQLEWSGQGFELTDQVHAAFAPLPEDRWRVLLEAETTHAYQDAASIGGFSRDLLTSIGLEAPTRQGLMEPPETGYAVDELTTYARTLSPRPSRFVLQGPGWDAVCEAVPQPIGVVERLTLSAGAQTAPLGAESQGLELMGAELHERFLGQAHRSGAEIALLGYRRGSADGQVPSRLTGPTMPAALHLSRGRFPTLTDAEATRVAGPAAVVDPAWVQLTWALPSAATHIERPRAAGQAVPGDAEGPEPNPAIQLLTLLEAVQHHDAHRHAAQRGSDAATPEPPSPR